MTLALRLAVRFQTFSAPKLRAVVVNVDVNGMFARRVRRLRSEPTHHSSRKSDVLKVLFTEELPRWPARVFATRAYC
jgi:hypothetical protein